LSKAGLQLCDGAPLFKHKCHYDTSVYYDE